MTQDSAPQGKLTFCPPMHGLSVAQWAAKLASCDTALLPGRWWVGLSCDDILGRVQACSDPGPSTKVVAHSFVYDCKYCSDDETAGAELTLPDGTQCDDNDIETRNDRCLNGVCVGTPYTCGFCERHNGESCVRLSQVNAGTECEAHLHGSECQQLQDNLMGCPHLSHIRPTATADHVVPSLAVMGQCCHACATGVPLADCASWSFSVQTLECRLYASRADAVEDGRAAFNWHTGHVGGVSCAGYGTQSECETSGPCAWVAGACQAAADSRAQWYFVPEPIDATLSYYDRSQSLTLLAEGVKGSADLCRDWCRTLSVSVAGQDCQAWNWWAGNQSCELLRTVRRWTQTSDQQVYSGFRSPVDGLPYAGAGVCKAGGTCLQAGATDDSPAASPAHVAGDRMGCGMCNPLSDTAALSELSYPKYCYVRTDVCDMDVACNIAEKTCGDNSADQYYRPDIVPCAPPAWDTRLYPENDLSPYDTPWDFPDKGLWATWSKRWLFDADRGLYYHVTLHGTPPSAKANRVYACSDVPQCSGASITCPAAPALHTQSCREPMGSCDLREFCAGTSDTCPPDVLAHGELVCQPRVPNAYLTGQSALAPTGVRGHVAAAYGDELYPVYATLPVNLGKECWAVCQKSGPCSFCGTGKCCKKSDADGGCLASEGGRDQHICVMGEWLDSTAWTATAKSTSGPSDSPGHVLDDDDTTVWHSDQTLPQWIRLVLPGVACVSGLRFGGGPAPVEQWVLLTDANTTVAAGKNTDTSAGTWSHEAHFAWACDSAFQFRMTSGHPGTAPRLGLARLQLFGQMQGLNGNYRQTLNGGVAHTRRDGQTGATVAGCLAACDGLSWCKSFNYHKPDSRCDLFDLVAADVGGLKLDWPQHPLDYYEKPDLLYEDLCDIPQTCRPASQTPWECPPELVPGVEFNAPVVTLGEVAVPRAFHGDYIEAEWHGHDVTCGLLWYAWGWGTSAGGFESTSGGALRGPTAEGSGHDWFTTVPGRPVPLTRPVINPQDGQQFYVTVEVTNRDGRRAVVDAVACCEAPAAAGVTNGTAAHAACCAAAAGVTARQLVISPMVVYDSSPPACPHPPCLRVGGMVPPGGRQRTCHPAPPALVIKPFAEPHSGVAAYAMAVAPRDIAAALWAATRPPRVPHGPVCEVAGDCPAEGTAEQLVAPSAFLPPDDSVLTASVTARNGAGLNSTAQATDFVVDTSPPVAAVPQALLYQPQAEFVSLAALWDAHADAECAEGADRGIELLSWALYEGASPGDLPPCALPSAAPPAAAGHSLPGGCDGRDAAVVCVRLQWRACNGLWGPLSRAACANWTAPAPACARAPRFRAAGPPSSEAAYRVWRVHPELQSLGCLRHEGTAGIDDFTETTKDYYTACPEPEHLPGHEFTGAAFPDYTGVAEPWQHVDWRGALSTPSAITDRVYAGTAAPFRVFFLSIHVSNFAGLSSGGTYRVVLDMTPPLVLGTPTATVVNYTTIEIVWEGVFDDPESGMDWFEWELEHAQRLHSMYWTNTTGHPVPGVVRPMGATNVTVHLPVETFTENTPLRLRVHGLNRAGLRSTSNDTIFWVDFTPPVLVPGSEITVGRAGVQCWDRLTGPFSASWEQHFHDPHTWLERYFWAVGNTSHPQKYVPKTDVGPALTQTAVFTFDAGDDVIVTVWGENPMGLRTQSTSRVLRIDPSEVRPAWPLPVRDLHPDATPLDADIDFQSGRTGLRASWAGWHSVYGWIVEYRVSLSAVNGTQTFLLCPGVAVGLATNATSVDLPGCSHGALEHGLTYVWTVTAVGCNEWTTTRQSDGVAIDVTPPDLAAVTVADGPRHGRHEMDWQSHLVRVLSAKWQGDVREDVSPVHHLEWALGTAPYGTDVMDWTPAMASCVPPAEWCAHCAPRMDRDRRCAGDKGPEVCIRLQYKLCGGDWGGLSTTYCHAVGEGCGGPMRFPLSEHLAPAALLGYRVYRVDPADEDRGCLKAEGLGPVLEAWTEVEPELATSCGGAPGPITTAAFHQATCPAGLRTPPRSWCNGTAPGATRAENTTYATFSRPVCARLQWGMCGQWGSVSTVCCRDWAAPEGPGPAFGLADVLLPADIEGYRVYRVDPADPERGCLRAYGGVRWPWAWSGRMRDWQESARDFGEACPAAYQVAIGLPDTMAYQPTNLSLGTTYYAALRVTNEAGLSSEVSSDGVTWIDTALEPGDVHDGPLLLQDIDWQSDTSSLSVSWMDFYSFFGPERYEVCAGTQPLLCDIAAFENVTNLADGSPLVRAVPHPTHLQVSEWGFDDGCL